MVEANDPSLTSRPKRRLFAGRALTGTFALGIAVKDEDIEGDRCGHVQVLSAQGVGSFRPGYCGYICEGPDLPAQARLHVILESVPCLVDVGSVADISAGDIVEINNASGRMRIVKFADSEDHALVLTNRCNCNCLMCPDSEHSRREGHDASLDWIRRYLVLIGPDARHLSLTGGEPTLLQERLFTVLGMCYQNLPRARILLITNGRMFYYKDYACQLATHGIHRIVVAIALHSMAKKEHDRITGVCGSFEQTLCGLQHLLAYGVRVEVRIVIQQANYRYLYDLAEWICREFPGIVQVSFMGLELLGNAAKNRAVVWVDYQEIAPELGRAIMGVMRHGIVPRLYNLPLCAVAPQYWSLCAKSISDYKRTYKPECSRCAIRGSCGGLFGTVFNHRLTTVSPIERSAARV